LSCCFDLLDLAIAWRAPLAFVPVRMQEGAPVTCADRLPVLSQSLAPAISLCGAHRGSNRRGARPSSQGVGGPGSGSCPNRRSLWWPGDSGSSASPLRLLFYPRSVAGSSGRAVACERRRARVSSHCAPRPTLFFWCLKVASTYCLKTATSGSSGIAHPSVIICRSFSASCAA
jgi:hypothetical protein